MTPPHSCSIHEVPVMAGTGTAREPGTAGQGEGHSVHLSVCPQGGKELPQSAHTGQGRDPGASRNLWVLQDLVLLIYLLSLE